MFSRSFLLSTILLFTRTGFASLPADDEICVANNVDWVLKIYAAQREIVAQEKTQKPDLSPIHVDVQVYMLLDKVHKSPDELKNLNDMNITNAFALMQEAFKPANISFTMQRLDYVVTKDGWVTDEDREAMHMGDNGTLNVYWGETNPSSTMPIHLRDAGGPLRDGIFLNSRWTSRTTPTELTHEAGHWFGLLHTFEDRCNDDGDYIDDTPPSPPSCYRDVKACPGPNFMSYNWDRSEFTPQQMVRMHTFWHEYRAKNNNKNTITTTPTELTPLAPVEGPGRRPFYPEQPDKRLVFQKCHVKADGTAEETRENYCGSMAYCHWQAWRAAGESYSSTEHCMEARRGVPWFEPKFKSERDRANRCGAYVVQEEICGSEIYCRAFDEDNSRRPLHSFFIDKEGKEKHPKANDWYRNSAECLERHEPSPQDKKQVVKRTCPHCSRRK